MIKCEDDEIKAIEANTKEMKKLNKKYSEHFKHKMQNHNALIEQVKK